MTDRITLTSLSKHRINRKPGDQLPDFPFGLERNNQVMQSSKGAGLRIRLVLALMNRTSLKATQVSVLMTPIGWQRKLPG
jgi:hypothetical protein